MDCRSAIARWSMRFLVGAFLGLTTIGNFLVLFCESNKLVQEKRWQGLTPLLIKTMAEFKSQIHQIVVEVTHLELCSLTLPLEFYMFIIPLV